MQPSNSLNRHQIKNVIGRKNLVLSQINESKVDPNLQASRNYRTKVRSSLANSVNQSQNESFQRRTFNRGNNSTLQNELKSSDEFRTLLIQINIDRIVFGYVGIWIF